MATPSRAPLAALLFTVFLDLLGFGMVIPILNLYAERFGVGDVAITGLQSVYSLMQLFFAPIWGRVSDRYGRRPVLLLSIFGSCVSQLGYAVAPTFAGMVVARGFAGICGANISAAQAYIADSTDEKSRAAGMGMLGAALGFGFVLGPMFGGFLGAIDARLPFLVASGLALCNFILAAVVLREPRTAGERVAARRLTWRSLVATVTSPRLGPLIALLFVVTFGFALLENTFPFYLHRRFGFDKPAIGVVFGGVGVVMILAQGLLVRRLAAWIGERAMVIGGTALMALGMLACAVAFGQAMLAVAVVLVAGGNGINTPSMSSLISRNAGDQQGGVLGVAQSASAMARVLGPLAGGWLLAFGLGAPYVAAAVVIGLSCVAAALALKPPPPADEAVAPVAAH